MNLKTYKPTHPESAEFIKQIDEFLDYFRHRHQGTLNSVRMRYYHSITAADSTETLPWNPPDDSAGVAGLKMLRNFHKLWRVDFQKKDVLLDMYMTNLGEKVGYEVIFGIGGDLSVRCPSDNIAEYKLVLDDVTMLIEYFNGEMRDVEDRDASEPKIVSVYADQVAITISNNG